MHKPQSLYHYIYIYILTQTNKHSCAWRKSDVTLYKTILVTVRTINEYIFVFGKNTADSAIFFLSRNYVECFLKWYSTRREFFREILYKNIAIIAIQHSKIYFVDTFDDFSHTVEWNLLQSVWEISLYILA